MEPSLLSELEQALASRMPSLHEYEVRKSVVNLGLRWFGTLSYEEKWKISRELGGNRYVVSTMEIIDILMTELIKDYK